MASPAPQLFQNVYDKDHLGFWANNQLNYKQVADFLDLDANAVSKMAGVSKRSVRYDQKIPKDVSDRLKEIANVCSLVADLFGGDANKTALWFKTANPMLGDISPRDMLRFGRYKKLLQFVMSAVEESGRGEGKAAQ